jgi:hypothetical protein
MTKFENPLWIMAHVRLGTPLEARYRETGAWAPVYGHDGIEKLFSKVQKWLAEGYVFRAKHR